MKFKVLAVLVLLVCNGVVATPARAFADLMLVGDVETFISQKQFDQAIDRIKTALAATPQQEIEVRLDLMQRLANVYEQAGRWQEAARIWEQAAGLVAQWRGSRWPELSQWYDAASVAYEKAGQLEQALKAGAQAFAVDLDNLGMDHVALVPMRQRLHGMAQKLGDQQAIAMYAPVARGRGSSTATPTVPVVPIDQINVDFGQVDPKNFARVKVFFWDRPQHNRFTQA